jgi:quercetin dioxygenase-like cupin family protein
VPRLENSAIDASKGRAQLCPILWSAWLADAPRRAGEGAELREVATELRPLFGCDLMRPDARGDPDPEIPEYLGRAWPASPLVCRHALCERDRADGQRRDDQEWNDCEFFHAGDLLVVVSIRPAESTERHLVYDVASASNASRSMSTNPSFSIRRTSCEFAFRELQQHVIRRRARETGNGRRRAPWRYRERVHNPHYMASTPNVIPPGEALVLQSLITPTEHGIASRVLAKAGGGNLTLFAFDAEEGLSEHTSPFDAFVLVLEGVLIVTVAGVPVRAAAGTIVRMPARVPHAVDAPVAARMLLVMMRTGV